MPLGFEPALRKYQMNPKGIPPQSPVLRAASYPGKSGWCRPTPTGLKIARTPTQGSLADSVAGLEDTIPLGLQDHRSFRRSVGQWPRTEYPKGIGSNPSGIGHCCPLPTPARARRRTRMSALQKNLRCAPAPLLFSPCWLMEHILCLSEILCSGGFASGEASDDF